MTIQDLGSIGEFISSLAVLFTLIYLARQYRHSAEQARIESLNHALGTHVQRVVEINSTDEKAELFRKFCADFDALTLNERGRAHTLMLGLVVTFNQVLRLRKADMLEDEEFEAIQGTMISILRTTGGRQWWDHYRGNVPTSLNAHITNAINSPDIKRGPITDEQSWLFEQLRD